MKTAPNWLFQFWTISGVSRFSVKNRNFGQKWKYFLKKQNFCQNYRFWIFMITKIYGILLFWQKFLFKKTFGFLAKISIHGGKTRHPRNCPTLGICLEPRISSFFPKKGALQTIVFSILFFLEKYWNESANWSINKRRKRKFN